ncbi:MAG: hypothetical protein HKN94_03020 [Acidimicrobiales bacterium]|nr:hypothetical protein [Acidimicrobiales bacterium]RZV48669.1 MAG: hypothetical protein EX269_00930 [Acidimicrobiales bacterium]
MISENEAALLLAEANPAPDVDAFDLDDVGPVDYRFLLEEAEASEIAHDESAGADGKHLPWLAAAVVVLVVGLTTWALLRDGDGSIVTIDSGPTTTVELVTSTSTAPTTTAVPATTVAASSLSGIPVWLGSGTGQWIPAQASVPFAFTAMGDWNSSQLWNTEDRFAICVPQATSRTRHNCINGSVSVVRLEQGGIEATKELLSSVDGAIVSDEEPATIGGAEGIRFLYTHAISPTPGGQFQGDLDAPIAFTDGNQQTAIGVGPLGTALVSIVDVAGETMTVVFQGEDASRGAIEDGFHTNMEEGQQIIDSIIWAALQ